MSQYTRTCKWCDNQLPDGSHGTRKYCSGACQKAASNERSLQRGPTCAECGDRMHRGKDVLPQGQARCLKCKNGGRGYYIDEHGRRWSHGRSGYSQGCRCRVCRGAQAEGMRRYVEKRIDEFGVSPSAEYRRIVKGHDPFKPVFEREEVPCRECGELMFSAKPAGEAVHKLCRDESGWYISAADRLAVYERDGWTCQICFHPVARDSHYLSDWYPTLDHVVPQAVRVDHSSGNLRLACRYCNLARLNRPVEDDYLVRSWAIKRRGLEVV